MEYRSFQLERGRMGTKSLPTEARTTLIYPERKKKKAQIIIQNTLSMSKHAQWIFSTQLRLINSHQI